jgi:hypothetical protein
MSTSRAGASFTLVVFTLWVACASAQDAPPAKELNAGDAQKLVTIRRIVVEGSRLPAPSIIGLAQIKIGDQVNFVKLHAALQHVTGSGLVRNVEFEYESMPENDSDVVLHLKCTDEKPSAESSIRIPNVNEADVWTWLAKIDPLFTRDMPPTEPAIRIYSNWIAKFMEGHGDPKFQENFAIIAEGSSSTGGSVPDQLVFMAVKRRGVK